MARGDDLDKLSDIWAAILHLRRSFSSQMYSRLLDRSNAGENKAMSSGKDPDEVSGVPLVPWYVENGPGDIECSLELRISGYINPENGDGPGDIPCELELLQSPFYKEYNFYMQVERKSVQIIINGSIDVDKEDYEENVIELTLKIHKIDVDEQLFDINSAYIGADFSKNYPLNFVLNATPFKTTIISSIQAELLQIMFEQTVLYFQFDYTKGRYSHDTDIYTSLDAIIYKENLFNMTSDLTIKSYTNTLISPINFDITLQEFHNDTLPVSFYIDPISYQYQIPLSIDFKALEYEIEVPSLMSVSYHLSPDTKIYGVKFDEWETMDNTGGMRTYDAIGFSFRRSTTEYSGQDSFKDYNVGPFRIRKCLSRYDDNFKQQVIVAYDTDDNWEEIINDPEYGEYNRMIELPFFYYRRNSTYEFDVSQVQYDEFIPSPMHYRNGVMHSYVYISQYLLDSNFSSRSGTVPFTGTLDALRAGAKSKGFFLGDYPLYMSLTILMLIKYANLDISSVIGKPQQTLSATLTGITDSINGIDGSTSLNSLTEGRTLTFGIEDLFSNMNKLVDGIFSLDRSVFINENIESINSTPTSRFKGYSAVKSKLPEETSGKINKLMFDIQYPYLLLPESLSNNSPSLNAYFSKHPNASSVGSLVFGTADTDSSSPTGMYFSSGKQGVSLGWILSEDTREANGVCRTAIDCSMIVRTNVEHIEDNKIYGIDFSTSIPIRTDVSSNYTFTKSTQLTTGTDDFETYNAGPFMVRECISEYDSNTGKQVVILSEQDEGYEDIKDNERYNKVIEIPAFFYRRTSPYKFQVSCYQHEGFLPSPMHYRNGVMYEKVYVSKYALDSNGKSQTNKSVSINSLEFHRSKALSQGLNILDYGSYYAITILMLIKYANLDVQSVIGNGIDVLYSTTGSTDELDFTDGESSDGDIITLGIENLYGKSWTLIDGINVKNDVFFIDNKAIMQTPLFFSGSTNYPSSIVYNDEVPYILLADSLTTNQSIIDDQYIDSSNPTSINQVQVAGYDALNENTGLLSFKISTSSSGIARSIFFSEETVTNIKNPSFISIPCELEVPDPRKYGIRFDNYTEALLDSDTELSSSTTVGVRTNDSSSFTFSPSTTTQQGTDDFESYNAGPFMVRECITKLNNGVQEVIAYEGDINFNLYKDNASYNRMIEFPLFYYSRPSRYEFVVSSTQHEGFIPSPLHWRNGITYSKAYISKYPLNKIGRSRDNGYVANMSTLRSLARSQGLYLLDWSSLNTLWILMLIKYANLDISSVIGNGICVSSSTTNNPQVEQILSKDGSLNGLSNNPVTTFGIANLWGGNSGYFIDGITRYENSIFINENIANIIENLDVNKIGSAKVLTNIYTREDGYSGFIKELAYDPDFSYSLHPTDISSNININSKLADMSVSDLLNYTILIYGGAKQSASSSNRFADSPAPFFMKFAKSSSKANALGFFLGGTAIQNLTERQYDYEISCKVLIPVGDSEIYEDPNIYGVDFVAYYTALENGGILNTSGKRIRDSSSFTFSPSTTTQQGTDDFETYNAGPFMVRECISEYDSNTGKQVVLMYEDDDEWDTYKDDPSYNHFIEFPAFFYRRVTPYRFEVKAIQENGDNFLPSPMHYRNGVMYEKVYVSKYALDSEYMSRSGSNPLTNNTINTFRQHVLSKGMYLIDWPVVCSIAILMFIKYGSLDPSNIIGKGVTNTSGPVTNGATLSVLSKDGSNGTSIVTLGLENWWGNVYYVLDGLVVDSNFIGRIDENIESINSNPDTDTYVGYSRLGEKFLNTTAKNINKFAYDLSYLYSLHAAQVSTSGTNSYYGFNNGNPSVPWFGGYWGSSMANALTLFCQKSLTAQSNQLGCVGFFLSNQIRENVRGETNSIVDCSMIVRTNVEHIEDNKIYGIDFSSYAGMIDGIVSSVNTRGTRTNDSSSFTFSPSTTTQQGTDDFETYNAGPFMVRECISEYDSNTGKQVVILSEQDEGYEDIKDNERYNKVIEIPAFFYRRTSPYKFQVSCYQHEGFLPSPMHYRNGVMYEKVYVSKYALDSEYMSRSKTTPKTDMDLETLRSGVQGLGMSIIDLPVSMSLTILMLIKYANLDVQSVIGNGKTSGSNPVDNGSSDNILGKDGSNGTSIVTLGLENWWGNVAYMLDKTIAYNGYLYLNEDITLNSSTLTDYTKIEIETSSTIGMIKELAYNDKIPWDMHAKSTSSKQNLGDRFMTTLDLELHLALIGGSLQDGASFCGVFNMDISQPLNYSSQYVGGVSYFLSDETISDVKAACFFEYDCEVFILDESVSENDDRNIYGIDFSTSIPIRTDVSSNYTFTKSTQLTTGTDDFETYNAGPFMVRECISEYDSNTGKQVVLMYEDDDEWDTYKDDPSYNHFIEFPFFYYKRASRYEFKVSQIQYDGFLPSPMHYRNGVMYEKVYVSKYALDSEYMSRSGSNPLTNSTINTFRQHVLSKGIYLIDWPVVCSIAILMFIKYGSLDVQGVIGTGKTLNSSTVLRNGSSDNILGKDGSNGTSIVTLGLENWWGNVWYYVDGLYKKGEYLYINEDIESIYENPDFDDTDYNKILTKVACSMDTSKGVTFALDSAYPYSLHPTAVNDNRELASLNSLMESGILEAISNSGWVYKAFPLNLFLSRESNDEYFGNKTGAMTFCICGEKRERFRAKTNKIINCTMLVKDNIRIIRDDAIYGIDFSNGTTGLRTDDAVGLNFSPSTTTQQGTDDFETYNAGPFMVRECIFEYKNGTQQLVAYSTDEGYQNMAATGNYDIMIEFPMFFYRRTNRYKFQVSTFNHEGFLPSPMHYRNGVMYEKVYVSKYALDSEYMSRSGSNPLTNNTINTFRQHVLSKGMYLIDWPVVCSIAILMFIKYGSLDVQGVIGLGHVQDLENISIIPNGSTDAILSKDGSISENITSPGAVKTLGLENWWGNVWYYVDGLYKKGEYLYINEDISHITSNPNVTSNNPYLKLPTPVAIGNQAKIKVPAFHTSYPWDLHPVDITSDKLIESVSDYNWQNTSAKDSMSEAGWVYGKYTAAILLGNTLTISQDHTGARSLFFSELQVNEEITIDKSIDMDCSLNVVDQDLEVAGSDYRKYGINFIDYASLQLPTNVKGKRTEWAQSYEFRRSSLIYGGYDSFTQDNAGPFMVRECITKLNNGVQEVIAYEGDINFNLYKDNASYNRMIEFPLFYYSRPSRYEFIVSSSKYKNFLPSPMHYRNGVMYEKVYVSKYALNSNFMSQSGSNILTDTTLRNFRTNVRANGMYLIDWPVVCSIAILMFIKYGSLDVQGVIGLGHASMRNNRKVKTGVADSILSKDGGINNDITANGSIVTLGLENWWGNVWYYVDGLYKYGNVLYINEDIANITSNPRSSLSGYTAMSTVLPTMDGGIKQIAFDPAYPYSLHPTVVEENENMGDYYWYGPETTYIYQALFGGSYYDDTYCGALYLNLFTELGLSDESLGALAFFLKDPII